MFHHVERTRQQVWTQLLTHTIVILGAVLMVYPVIWLVSASFKPLNETFFIWTWGDFFTQLIFLNDQSVYTVPVVLRTFLGGIGVSSYGQIFAISVISLIPIFGFFIASQSLLIEGVATSGIKG